MLRMTRFPGARTTQTAVLVWLCAVVLAGILAPAAAHASELDLQIPAIDTSYSLFGMTVSGLTLLYIGLAVCLLGMGFGLAMYTKVKRMPVHKSMSDVSNIIYETCKTYLLQQGRLLILLEVFIGAVSYTHLRAHETPEHLVC